MATTFTIDDTGFHEVGFSGYLADWQATFRSEYGSDIDLTPESPDGQLVAALAQRDTNFEQSSKQIWLNRSPSGASGAALSRLVQLNGISRKSAQFSTVPITMGGTPGTVIPIDSLIADPNDPTLPSFKTAAPYTIGGGGTVTGQAICSEAGPVNVSSSPPRLTLIQTITSGWDTVTNTSAAAPGRLTEKDPQLRARRARSVAMPSQSMLDGLYAALADLAGVDDVVVYENTTESYDIKGHPPHSIHAIVDGGLDADIANAIWVKASMGATKVGTQALNVIDTQGNPQEMRWDIPIDVNVYITVQLSRAPNPFEIASIQDALVAYGQETSRIGQNVPWFDLASPINDLDITGGPGLPSVVNLFLGDAASPTDEADLVVAFNARPRYDVSRVSVVVAP
jgi:uncharacterized phage protein gp47/JayE